MEVVGGVRKATYPSSAPDTICSSLMSWTLSMEPLQKGVVKGGTESHPLWNPTPHGAHQTLQLPAPYWWP